MKARLPDGWKYKGHVYIVLYDIFCQMNEPHQKVIFIQRQSVSFALQITKNTLKGPYNIFSGVTVSISQLVALSHQRAQKLQSMRQTTL